MSQPLIETFAVKDGRVIRSVHRRSGALSTSVLADTNHSSGLITADKAEAAFLQRDERPNWSVGTETVAFADLFAGLGSLSLGVLEASRALHLRGELRLAADLDLAALRVLRRSLDVSTLVARRLNLTRHVRFDLSARTTAAERDLIAHVGPGLRIAVAGPPCQGHSPLNNHSRHDDVRNHLYIRVVRFAMLTEPDYVLIENVAAIESDKRRSLERAAEALAARGYRVDGGLVNLHNLGVPQRRRRHVLVASAPHVRELLVAEVVKTHTVPNAAERTVGWAIADLEQLERRTAFDLASTPSPDNHRRIAYLHRSGEYDLPDHLRPPCHQGAHTYKSMYGRLNWDEPAQTITSGYGSMGQGRYVHPRQPRTITPHEAARLQMVPDFFDFSVAARRGQWAQMIGNAAPWKLAYAFALEMLR